MKRSIDETMTEARQFFLDRGHTAMLAEDRHLNEHLREMAEAVQESHRMIDVLRRQIEELHHVVGVR